MPLSIAGSENWHDVITPPANAEPGNQAAFADPITQLKDNDNFLKAIMPYAYAWTAELVEDSVFMGASGVIAEFDPIVLTREQKVMLVASVGRYSASSGNTFQLSQVLEDEFDNSYGALHYAGVGELITSVWLGMVTVPAGSYTPRMKYSQDPVAHELAFNGVHSRVYMGAIILYSAET